MSNAVAVAAPGMFRGVEIGWLQAQWRDCADKVAQMRIFRDMTGAKTDEILVALGEAEEMQMRTYMRYSDDEEKEIIRLYAEGLKISEIADKLGGGRTSKSVENKIKNMRKAGRMLRRGDMTVEDTPVVTVTDEPDRTTDAVAAEPTPDLPDGFEMIERELTELVTAEETLLAELGAVQERIEVIRVRLQGMLGLAGGVDDG